MIPAFSHSQLEGKVRFDNDRLSHWLAGALFSWVMTFLLLGLPIFHVWLKVPIARITTFTGICCALQLVITPWLFSARATRQNPSGRIFQRATAVVVLFSVITLLFFYYLRRSWPEDIETRRFTNIAMAGTIVFGVVFLAGYGVVSRHRKKTPPLS
jgi:hypothetical protein